MESSLRFSISYMIISLFTKVILDLHHDLFFRHFSIKINHLPSYQYQSINAHCRTRQCRTLNNLWEFGCGSEFKARNYFPLPKFLGSGKSLISPPSKLYITSTLDKILSRLNLLEPSQWIRECLILRGPCHSGILLENSKRNIKFLN